MSEPMPSEPDDSGRDGQSPEPDGGVVRQGLGGTVGGETDGESDTSARICWLDDDDAEDVIRALSSDTARSILSAIHERDRTASELAEAADTSVQNVRHHLDSLSEAGLTEVIDTRYSVKGREMDVYGPPEERTVVVVGREAESASLLDSLRDLLGGLAALGGVSLLVQAWASRAPAGATRVPDAVSAPATGAGPPPGLLVFLGGLALLLGVTAVARLSA